jgi:hypothetical protein
MMFHSVKNFVLAKILWCLTACLIIFIQPTLAGGTWPSLLHDKDSVLFIGNSKVGSEGGLQNHFRRTLTRADPPLSIQTFWPGMFNRPTLKDMYTEEVTERIQTGTDDLVIVSSGSVEAMKQFADLIRDAGKQMVLYATWAENPYLEEKGWAAFREATRLHMEQVKKFEKAEQIPVVSSGLIYYDLLADPIPFGLRQDYLFVPGSSVQNDLGTMVNVAALYAVTTGRSPVGLPMWEPFDPELVRAVQERVWTIVRDWKNGKINLKPIPERSSITGRSPQMSTELSQWPALLKDGDSVYYVGNSFIGSEGGLENHFPRLLSQIKPAMDISTSSIIFWGRGLQSMYTDEVREEIATGRHEVVVVTSGPPDLLKKFHRDIEAAGSRMAVHMTWGRNPTINDGGLTSFREQTIRIVETLQQFEKETKVPVIPCGLIFYDLIVDPPAINGLRLDWVFMIENIHQNHIGTLANAAAHYAVMTGRSPAGLPMWDPYPEELVKAVQERAWKIVRDWKAGRVEVKPVPE